MTTILKAYNPTGRLGVCNARCYNSLTNTCNCICHGRNHGAGLETALRNTRANLQAIWYDLLQRYPRLSELHINGFVWHSPQETVTFSVSMQRATSDPSSSSPAEPKEPSGT